MAGETKPLQPDPKPDSARRLLGVPGDVLLVVATAGVVAFASSGTSLWAPPRRGAADPVEILSIVALLSASGLTMAAAVVHALHRMVIARERSESTPRTMMLRALPITVVVVASASLFAIAKVGLEPGPGAGDPLVRADSDRPGTPWGVRGWWDPPVKANEGEAASGHFGGAGSDGASRLPLALVALGIAAAVVVGTAWWYIRSGDERGNDGVQVDSDQEAAHDAVVGTIDSMLADPDPNTAIIGAYARLLEGLEACGWARRDYEGPMEHLHRVLRSLDVRREPVRQLIELFAHARFSTHTLNASHRVQALDALRAVATDLDVGRTTPRVGEGPRPLAHRP